MTQLKLILMAILAIFTRLFALPTSAARRGGGKSGYFSFLPALSVVCIIALMPSTPAMAGYKEDFLSELLEITQRMGTTGNAYPGLFSAVNGMCLGISTASGRPVPEATISEILRVQRILLQGKKAEAKDIHNIGKLCLDYMENTMRKEGASDAQIQTTFQSVMSVILPQMRAAVEQLKSLEP